MLPVKYSREQHAAHCYYTGKPLHDLERWDVAQHYCEPRPAGVPRDADKHVGYVRDGVAHTVFVRVAKPTGDCGYCKSRESR